MNYLKLTLLLSYWTIFTYLGFNQQANSQPISANCYCEQDEIVKCKCTNIQIKNTDSVGQLNNLCKLTNTLEILEFVNLTQLQNTNLMELINNQIHAQCDINLKSIRNLSLIDTDVTRLYPIHLVGVTNLTSLNISNNRLLNSYGEKVFQLIGRQIIRLIAISNPVRSLTQDVFRGLVGLQSLILSDNKIGYIETGVFSNDCCANLRELRLDSNILTVLDADSLIGLNNLEILDLRNNPIQQLDANVFTPCASTLTELLMSHNDQATFGGFAQPTPKLFSKLNRLRKLEIIELKLSNLTGETFVGLESLRELSLRGNRLIQLPIDLFQATHNLRHLDLADNWLVCLPSSSNPNSQSDFLSGLPLRWIDLSWNRLTHLNQLTARSLSLFDNHTSGQTRLVLNLTANPWQRIDDNTFCNPDGSGITRPLELIIGPLPAIPFVNWHTSLGLWTARAMWPNGPFSLIGNLSLLRGLMLDNEQTSKSTWYDKFKVYRGKNEALNVCHALQNLSFTPINFNQSWLVDTYLKTKKLKSFSEELVSSSIASNCPRLTIRKLENWELLKLINYSLITKIEGITQTSLNPFEQGSRLYLLVIVGICISFLFVALTVIMCYRAWSRKTSQKFSSNNDMDVCDTILNQTTSAEKPLLLLRSRNSQFEDSEKSCLTKQLENNVTHCNGNINSKSKKISLNNTTHSPTDLNREPDSEQTFNTGNKRSDGNNQIAVIDRIAGRSFSDRPKSDPEAAGLDEVNNLISLGIV